MGIVDDLLARPGLYLGTDEGHGSAAARIAVEPLPGRSGVSLEYETLQADAAPERVRGHHERSVLARTADGGTILVIGHSHADTLAVLRESPTEPGTFEVGAEGSPFPMKVVLSVPAPGRLRYSWWYAAPGEEIVQRDVAELGLVG